MAAEHACRCLPEVPGLQVWCVDSIVITHLDKSAESLKYCWVQKNIHIEATEVKKKIAKIDMTWIDKLWWKTRCNVWKNDIFNGKETQQNTVRIYLRIASSQATHTKFSFLKGNSISQDFSWAQLWSEYIESFKKRILMTFALYNLYNLIGLNNLKPNNWTDSCWCLSETMTILWSNYPSIIILIIKATTANQVL